MTNPRNRWNTIGRTRRKLAEILTAAAVEREAERAAAPPLEVFVDPRDVCAMRLAGRARIHEDAGFDRVLIGYFTNAPDGFVIGVPIATPGGRTPGAGRAGAQSVREQRREGGFVFGELPVGQSQRDRRRDAQHLCRRAKLLPPLARQALLLHIGGLGPAGLPVAGRHHPNLDAAGRELCGGGAESERFVVGMSADDQQRTALTQIQVGQRRGLAPLMQAGPAGAQRHCGKATAVAHPDRPPGPHSLPNSARSRSAWLWRT